MALAEVALRDGNLAMGAVTEFDASIAASKIRTDELFAMLDVFRDHEISRLYKRGSV